MLLASLGSVAVTGDSRFACELLLCVVIVVLAPSFFFSLLSVMSTQWVFNIAISCSDSNPSSIGVEVDSCELRFRKRMSFSSSCPQPLEAVTFS